MRLFILFAQRVERYEGEYAPEALDAVTEFMVEENDGLMGEIESGYKPLVGKDFVAIKWLRFDVSASEIQKHLVGTPQISAKLAE